MKNLHYISALVFLFSFSIVVFILSLVQSENFIWLDLTNWGLSIARLVGLLFLLHNGTFLKTIYFKITLVLFSVITIGSLLKIMHWPGSKNMLTIGLLGMTINYFLRFVMKHNKSLQDYLKVLFVISIFLFTWGIIMHLPHFREFVYIPNIILLLLIIEYWRSNYNNKAWLKQ